MLPPVSPSDLPRSPMESYGASPPPEPAASRLGPVVKMFGFVIEGIGILVAGFGINYLVQLINGSVSNPRPLYNNLFNTLEAGVILAGIGVIVIGIGLFLESRHR